VYKLTSIPPGLPELSHLLSITDPFRPAAAEGHPDFSISSDTRKGIHFAMTRFTLATAAILGLAHQALGDLQPCGQAQYDPAQVSSVTRSGHKHNDLY
jgi:hypothetical protein